MSEDLFIAVITVILTRLLNFLRLTGAKNVINKVMYSSDAFPPHIEKGAERLPRPQPQETQMSPEDIAMFKAGIVWFMQQPNLVAQLKTNGMINLRERLGQTSAQWIMFNGQLRRSDILKFEKSAQALSTPGSREDSLRLDLYELWRHADQPYVDSEVLELLQTKWEEYMMGENAPKIMEPPSFDSATVLASIQAARLERSREPM